LKYSTKTDSSKNKTYLDW